MIWASLGFGTLHDIDHILRGGPEIFTVVPFLAGGLGSYPLLLGGYFLEMGPLYFMCIAALYLLVHPSVPDEQPHDVVAAWTCRGDNATGIDSLPLGIAALVADLGLHASLLGLLAASAYDGALYGFTWRLVRSGGASATPAVAFAPAPGGGSVTALWKF